MRFRLSALLVVAGLSCTTIYAPSRAPEAEFILGPRETSEPSAVFRAVKIGKLTVEFRTVACTPQLIDAHAAFRLEGVEIRYAQPNSREASKADLIPAVVVVRALPKDEQISYKLKAAALNAVFEATCQTITQLGNNPDLVYKYSLKRDQLISQLIVAILTTQTLATGSPYEPVPPHDLFGRYTRSDVQLILSNALASAKALSVQLKSSLRAPG